MWIPLAVWIGLCGAGFVFALLGRLPRTSWSTALLLIAAAAIAARLIPIILYPDPLGRIGIDISAYASTARAVLDRRDVYELPLGTHPYPPLHMYVFAAAQCLADRLDASFFVLVRLPQAAADVGTAMLVALIVRDQRGDDDGVRFGFAYALCPLPILVTVYHGQFDAVSVFFSVLAFWVLLRSSREPAFVVVSGVALALGTMEKMWPVLLLPVMLAAVTGWRWRSAYLATFGTVCGALTTFYVAAFGSTVRAIVDAIEEPHAVFPTGFGLGLVIERTFGDIGFLRWFAGNGESMAVVAALVAAVVVVALQMPPARAIVAVLVVLLATTPSSETYRLVWLIPFGLLAGDRVWTLLIIATSGTWYAIAMLVAGGMFFPPLESAVAREIVERSWMLEYARWVVLVAWLATIVWAASNARIRERPAPA